MEKKYKVLKENTPIYETDIYANWKIGEIVNYEEGAGEYNSCRTYTDREDSAYDVALGDFNQYVKNGFLEEIN